MSEVAVAEFQVEMIPIEQLRPHPRNYRIHPQDQIDHLIQSIKTNGIYRPIVVAQDLTILAGHGVVLAARTMGLDELPVRRLPIHPNDPRALKLLAGDNEISHLGEVDDKALAAILSQIRDEDALGLLGTGFDDKMLADLILATPQAKGGEQAKEMYTTKIQIPTYQPAPIKPRIAELFDPGKTDELAASIEATQGITEEERAFLLIAAQRHTVLKFNLIADYYAQASAPMQALMEQSALVIIDFDKAVEYGFVELTQRLAGFVQEEYGDDDAD